MDPGLALINQALYDEFVRVTGCTSREDFSAWIEDLKIGICCGAQEQLLYASFSSREQAAMLLGYLRSSPPVAWPSIDLAA